MGLAPILVLWAQLPLRLPCRFVPGNLQVLWANMVAIVWNVVLSYLSNKAVTEDTTVAKKK